MGHAATLATPDAPASASARPAPRETLARVVRRHAPAQASKAGLLFHGSVVVALVAGWMWRDADRLTPESGWGYALGIIGLSLMFGLLIYPLRKRLRHAPFPGSVPFWFRLHMAFGLLGPLAILWHCTYRMGSPNANAALISMLLVAGSGLVGRYFYTRLHYGLYGQRASARELMAEAELVRSGLAVAIGMTPELREHIDRAFALANGEAMDRKGRAVRFADLAFLRCRIGAGRALRRALAMARGQPRDAGDAHIESRLAQHHLRALFDALAKLAHLARFERLFRVWHILHVPLVAMLAVTAIVHVVAVHLY